MTPWTWWAGELEDDVYSLAEGKTRDEVIQEAARQLKPGERFRIVEARASENRKHEGSDMVPFLRTRNHEILTVGPVASEVDHG